jgi:hypothetical protein
MLVMGAHFLMEEYIAVLIPIYEDKYDIAVFP